MADYDLAVLGGTIVGSRRRSRQHVYVRDGVIAAITPDRLPADTVVDATGLLVLPGMVDTHVHLMDPGDPAREDFPTGTAAAGAAGVTTIVEHTHAHPVRSVDELEAKRRHLEGRSNVDYGLAAHVWPDRLNDLVAVWRAGAVFFKVFTCTTHGVPGLEAGDLLEALETMARFGGPSLIHCEDEALTRQAERLLKGAGRDDPTVITEWRSREAELVAISTACILVELTGARASVAHVSSSAAAEIVARHRSAGAAVAAEACPQYFLLREEEILDHGPFRKFTPPARARTDDEEATMWGLLRRGVLTHVSSDHAPATIPQKQKGGIWGAPFGLPGLDTTLPLLVDAALSGRLSFEDVVRRYAEVPARWYGFSSRKGSLAVGADADIVLVDPSGRRTLANEDVLSKAGWTPYAGREVKGGVVSVYLRGEVVAEGGRPVGALSGRFLPGPGSI